MRRALVLVVVLLCLSAWPASAQLFPPGSPEPVASAERVLVDTVLYVRPPRSEGLCMVVNGGRLTVTVKRIADAPVEQRPARFTLSGFMADPDAGIEIPVSNQESSATTAVNGSDRYCWSVAIDAPETEGMPAFQQGGYVQKIALTMTLATP
jgi:hypothetical protein